MALRMSTTSLTKELLHRELVVNRKSFAQVGREFSVSQRDVSRIAGQFGLRSPHRCFMDVLSKDVLLEMYVTKNMSMMEIANHFGLSHKTGVRYWLKKYGIPIRTEYYKDDVVRESHNYVLWKGHEEISGSFWSNIKRGAAKREIPFEITIEDVWQKWVSQAGRCALSGILLQFAKPCQIRLGTKEITASLDRIDSTKGYVVGNVQWVHKVVNLMKQNLTEDGEDGFVSWCERIYYHRKVSQ